MTAQVSAVRLAAAHEGVAELVVDVTYANGGVTEVPLDSAASQALFAACGVTRAEDLLGVSWEKVRDALAQAYNR